MIVRRGPGLRLGLAVLAVLVAGGDGHDPPAEGPVAGPVLSLPAALPEPPFDPGPGLLLAGMAGTLFALDNSSEPDPVDGRFARYTSATGWTTRAAPPRLQTADLSVAGAIPVLTGIACPDDGSCDQGGPLVTATYDAATDRWWTPTEFRREPTEEFGASGLVRRYRDAVLFVADGELIVLEPGAPERRLRLPGHYPDFPCVTGDTVTVLTLDIAPQTVDERDQGDLLRAEAALMTGRFGVRHVNVEAGTVSAVLGTTPVGLSSPEPPRAVTPICLHDGVLALGDLSSAVWRPAQPRWSPFDAGAIGDGFVPGSITLDDGRTILLVRHSPGVESIVTISAAGEVTGVEALPSEVDGPQMSRRLVAVGSQAVLYQHVAYDPPRISLVTVAGT